MKQAIYTSLAALGLLLLLGLGGCSPDINLDDSTLTLSRTEIDLPGEVTTPETVTVTASADWAVAREASWLTVTKTSSTQLSISAEPNRTGRTRTAQVMLTSGRQVETLVVSQSSLFGSGTGTAGSISVETSTLDVQVDGGEIVLPVTTESADWGVILTHDWLTATINPKKNTIALSIPANLSREARTATLIVEDRITGDNVSVAITQEGVMYYVIPFLGFGSDMETIEAFETKRQSRVLERPKPNDTNATNRYYLKFRTRSPLLYRAEYKIENGVMTEVKLFGAFSTRDEEEGAIRYLLEHGFVYEGGVTFFEPNSRALVKSGVVGSEWFLHFTQKPKQPQPQPTFDKMPLGILSEATWYSYGPDRIQAWEEARGGVSTNPAGVIYTSGVLKITWTAGTDYQLPFASTEYYISDTPQEHRIKQLVHVFPASPEMTKKFFWFHRGNLLFTDEFVAILRQAGFEQLGYQAGNNKSIIINNSTRKIQAAIRLHNAGTASEYVSAIYFYVP